MIETLNKPDRVYENYRAVGAVEGADGGKEGARIASEVLQGDENESNFRPVRDHRHAL